VRGEPLRRWRLEHLPDEVFGAVGDVGPRVGVEVDGALEHGVEDALLRLGPEGRHAGEQDVDNDAGGPDVGPGAVVLAEHLGRDVVGAAHHVGEDLAGLEEDGEAEVDGLEVDLLARRFININIIAGAIVVVILACGRRSRGRSRRSGVWWPSTAVRRGEESWCWWPAPQPMMVLRSRTGEEEPESQSELLQLVR
jgi:hypothetical protein